MNKKLIYIQDFPKWAIRTFGNFKCKWAYLGRWEVKESLGRPWGIDLKLRPEILDFRIKKKKNFPGDFKASFETYNEVIGIFKKWR